MKKISRPELDRKGLSQQPMSALTELANAGQIERPMVVYTRLNSESWIADVNAGGGLKAVATARSKSKARYAAASVILQQLFQTTCPTPLKPRFATRRACAEKQPDRRVYACECGWYHWAKKK